MRKLTLFLCMLFIPCFSALAAEQPFTIDTVHIYAGMDRPYGQGYTPATTGNTMTVVLPLLSDTVRGDITAVLAPRDPYSAPFRLQGLEQRFSQKEYSFASGKVSAYLVTFRLSLYPSRKNGEYPLRITVSGVDAQGNALKQAFDLEAVVADGIEDPQAPLAEIAAFETDGAYLTAGEAGELRLKVRNASPTRAMENMTVAFSDASGDILPAGADILRMGRLVAGESGECAFPVRVSQKAAAQLHPVGFTVSYTYGGGKPAGSSVKYTVDVRQPVRFAHTDAALPPRVTQGDVPSFSMTLMNMGKSTLSNVLLTFAVPGLSSGGSVLAGTIAPGESKAASANFRVDGSTLGEVSGMLTISYEDAYGEYHETKLPLTTLIQKKAEQVYASQESSQDKERYPLWIPYTALGAAALLLILQRALLLKRIRILEEHNL